MSIFALADLHLSGTPPSKPMDRFSPAWSRHWEKIQNSWLEQVQAKDTVLIAGDTSWAMKWADARVDLDRIAALPGHKVLIRGNHDYWWGTVGKMAREMNDAFFFLHNNYILADGWAICGSRGWITADDPTFRPEADLPIYRHEVERVKASLSAAYNAGHTQLLLMLHFPPVYQLENQNGFTNLIKEFSVQLCVFGHIHGDGAHMAPQGKIQGATCHLVACDALNFHLKKLF